MIAGSDTQEAVDLLNEIRKRAGVPSYTLADFPDLESFIDAMLDERGWEFVTEGHRRRDLIRQGRLISDAQARGKTNAQPHHVLFPIPLSEIDSNPLVEQNPGINLYLLLKLKCDHCSFLAAGKKATMITTLHLRFRLWQQLSCRFSKQQG